ncbi:DegQ family serine endoprotease [Virgifigura deserti]|uniref:DegQ family serine endoprotease n=1 Tax=Virgifigura deserti TaxID=2268457 RepID=UPI003CCBCF5D
MSRTFVGAIAGAALLATPMLTMAVPAQAETAPGSFADLAEEVTPAVVNISSKHTAEVAGRQMQPGLPFEFPEGSPFEEFFRQFQDRFGPRDGAPRQMPDRVALGSGFIIDPEGYVVTNNHVIADASEIKVTLTGGEEYPAELVGTDPKTDLALLKIEADEPLPSVEFGDSDAIRVGDWVLAVGNPFGLGGSVTTGIVSAHGRYINAGPYDDFLQIDAAINQGNSGGPTFNTEGEVIGINTAIASPNGGSVGIGFAIPSKLAEPIIAQLREDGSVDRGWLGVQIQPVTPEIAAALGLDEPVGALVASVQPDSPAARAELRQGDVILDFAGTEVEKMRELPLLVATTPAGKKAELTIWRDGVKQTVEVEIGKLQPEQVAAAQPEPTGESSGQSEALGATLATLTPELKRQFGIPSEVEGVVVVDVEAGGPAAEKGLRPGDVIEKVSQNAVSTPAEVEEAAQAAEHAVLLLINRQGNSQFVALDLDAA